MIHINDVRKSLRIGMECNIKFVEATGDVVIAENIAITSSYHKNNTINIKFLTSGEIRKVRTLTIIEYNGMEVYL